VHIYKIVSCACPIRNSKLDDMVYDKMRLLSINTHLMLSAGSPLTLKTELKFTG